MGSIRHYYHPNTWVDRVKEKTKKYVEVEIGEIDDWYTTDKITRKFDPKLWDGIERGDYNFVIERKNGVAIIYVQTHDEKIPVVETWDDWILKEDNK